MKVKDILHHFLECADWVDPDRTDDRVIIGDQDINVDRCMVTLTDYINRNLEIKADHFPPGSTFQLIS
jgi:hypothetical protein